MKSLLNTIEMYFHHNILNIYRNVDCYISPSQFLKNKVLEMGFTGKIQWIPNFIDLDLFPPGYEWEEDSIVYFGRISKEKGLLTLIQAAMESDLKLKIIGDGPIRKELQSIVKEKDIQNVFFLGFKSGDELRDEIKKSMTVIVPSEWYENNPMSVIEAFALGKPVIGARIGGIPELVIDNETGLTFESGSTPDLKDKINWLVAHPEEISRMGRNARKMAEQEFTSETHYERLMRLYNSVLKN